MLGNVVVILSIFIQVVVVLKVAEAKYKWSLQFKTLLFNSSLHFKTSYQWHHLYMFSINIPLF